MIVERKNKLTLTLLLFITNSVLAQTRKECNVTDTFSSKIITINLPTKYKKSITKYDEGIFIDYIFQDGANLTLFQGALQKIPFLSKDQGYYPLQIDTIKNRISHSGILENKVWREDQLGNIRIYYNKVPVKKKSMYDLILDNILTLPYVSKK